MVLTRKKRQSNRRSLSQLDEFEQGIIFGDTVSERKENTTVNEGTVDKFFTVGTSGKKVLCNENTVKVKTLERCRNEKIDKEMSSMVDTVEYRVRNAILTAIDSIVAAKTDLAIRSVNLSSERDATSVIATSQSNEEIGSRDIFENASENKLVHHISNLNDETRNNIPDEVSELSVRKHALTGNHTLITWWHDKQPKQIKSPCSLPGAF